jgi:mono/diheme cytochrome c family protein
MAIFRLRLVLALGWMTTVWLAPGAFASDDARSKIEFDRDVRPILSNHCVQCHGPDDEAREAGLRLDVRESAVGPADSGDPAIVPGKPGESNLVKRIFSTRKNVQMPPPVVDKPLSDRQKETLRAWIEQGAEYRTHWSFTPPTRPPLPEVKAKAWPRNAIDRFILGRLDREGLSPTAEADRTTLIRRLSLDLTGLPPAPARVDAFLEDKSGDAYDRLVDSFLADPHFGERLAVDWLDAARFADTHGFHIDSGRDMTRWRAWVIDAFNQNVPYDRFVVEQLAGDLLPNATVRQKIASGFNRNNMINFEGGAVPEEYHTAYVVDRVNTTGTVFLGLTVACAQCHDHKFDPITQKDFYRLYAFFNNVPEKGLDGSKGNANPLIVTPTPEQERQIAGIDAAIQKLEMKLADPLPNVDAQQAAWETESKTLQPVTWTVVDSIKAEATGGASLKTLADMSLRADGPNPANTTYTLLIKTTGRRITGVKLEALPDDGLNARGPGRSVNGNFALSEVSVKATAAGAKEADARSVKLKAATADFSQQDFDVARAIDGRADTHWAIFPEVGKPHWAVFELESPLELETGSELRVTLEFQSQFGQHQIGRLRLSVTDNPNPRDVDALPAAVRAILAKASEARDDAGRLELRKFYRTMVARSLKPLNQEIEALRKQRADAEKQVSTTMVMAEMPRPRDTFMLVRGQYDKKGEQVSADVPAFLPPLTADAPKNRLGLARWLVDAKNPLTSRVAVNRIWQMIFGAGLARTSEDLGSQGELPSHPELLDWLAVELQQPTESKGAAWELKGLIRLIVTSATYRQASSVSPDRLAKDPENRLLARGPRARLQAEFLRDQALAVSGLLRDRIGGKSVSPYQPAGLWEELMSREDGANWSAQTYKQDHGDDLYRRTIYTFWKRTSPPPTLATFDAPDRETCTVRRARTNTPLQALVLLNDPTYVEAARKLAERMMTEGGQSVEDRIVFAFRLTTARRPKEIETVVLREIYLRQLSAFRENSAAALKLLSVGESPRNASLDSAELGAWSSVASVILNLDETVTKG